MSKPTNDDDTDTLPPFGDDPVDRLRHTLAVYGSDVAPHEWAIRATANAIPGHSVTGLTWGDLQEILRRLS